MLWERHNLMPLRFGLESRVVTALFQVSGAERSLQLQPAVWAANPNPNRNAEAQVYRERYCDPNGSFFSNEMYGSVSQVAPRIKNTLYDHRPYPLHEDDYTRVCLIPKKKGANFRDLPGILVGEDNVARRDPKEKQKMPPSGKPLVPDYAFTFDHGKSKRPFARLWWDETVPTVLTGPQCHSQAALHPEEDRILTIREHARLQGFPDYYRFCGTVKERYCQVGNAVAVPVARALGYALGLAIQHLSGREHLMNLPPNFSLSTNTELAESLL